MKRRWAKFAKWLQSDPKDSPRQRGFVRLFVPLLFIAACAIAYEIAHHTEVAPGVAFENHLVYAGLLSLLIFYGALLLLLPLARAVFSGELPIELTTKGPRYAEDKLALSRKATEGLEDYVDLVEKRLKSGIEKTAGGAAAGIQDLERDLEEVREELARIRRRRSRSWRI
jgi:hypothetical protein